MRIAALESEFVGFGASGRNGGWCSAIFPTSLRKIASTSSRDAAVRMQRAMNDTVAEIEAVVAAEGLAARGMEPAALTRQEAEVLQRLAEGRTNREIADELFLSTRTVDMHVQNVFTKLDCSSRAAAVRQAVQRGLIAVG